MTSMDGTYKDRESRQELQVTFRCKVKHNPGDTKHLTVMLQNHLKAKGLTMSDDLIIEI